MSRWLSGPWASLQREVDVDVLWPIIRRNAESIDIARAAFALHAARDSAWRALPDDERGRQIEALPDAEHAP